MHFLLIDPTETALELIPYFLKEELEVGIVITKEYTSQSILKNVSASVKFFDLAIDEWNSKLSIVSAVSWSYAGAKFLNKISNQIKLANASAAELKKQLIDQYFYNIPLYNNTSYFETLSYKGRHVLIGAFSYIDGKWSLYTDFNSSEYKNLIESVYLNLDNLGIINGPGQSFCLPHGDIKVKQHTANGNWVINRNLVTRNFLDIWPTVVKNEESNPKKSINKFYQWADSGGSTKKFKLCEPDKT